MTYTPTIYDWPSSVEPHSQYFRAAGGSVAGGMTLGGASVENPEPGGRAELFLEFDRLAADAANLDASWLLSRMTGGNVMRVPLWTPSAQIVSDEALGGVGTTAVVTVAGTKGGTTFKAALAPYGRVLNEGHVIGFTLGGYEFAHMVMSVSYNGSDVATIGVSPPLRRAVTTSDVMTFRPTMLVTCPNARDVATNYRFGIAIQLNAMRMVEAMV